MQTIEIYLEANEGEKGAHLLKEIGITDVSLVKSESGDLLVIRHPQDKTDEIIAQFKETFNFEESHRGIILSSPDVVLPKEEGVSTEKSAWELMIGYGEENSKLDSKYVALFFFSTVVAALGLITDNVAVVVGAMIIAPAFGPIASASIGIVAGRMDLFRNGMKNEIIGVIIAIGTAALIGLLLPGVEMNESLRTRMYPTIFDLFVALAAGAAGGYVLVSGRSTTVVGVMVAAALLPVMAAIGISFVFLNPMAVLGAFLLLLVNIVSISLAMVIVFWFAGPKQERKLEYHEIEKESDVAKMIGGIRENYDYKVRRTTVKKMIKYSVVLIVIMAIPLLWLTYEDLISKSPTNEIKAIFEAQGTENLELGAISIETNDIMVTVYDYSDSDEEQLQTIYRNIKSKIDRRYSLEFNVVQAVKNKY